MQDSIKQVILIVMDGWGIAPSWGGNAITQAYTPNFNNLWRTYPHTLLHASGKFVGLPGHESGNSEVGHLNLGAGKVVFQDVTFINEQLSEQSLDNNATIQELINHVLKFNSSINLMGLVSSGGVHSHINHLFILLKYFAKFPELKNRVYIHGFTDGRDRPMQEAIQVYANLIDSAKKIGCGKIATICGRYFSMDRDHHWKRIELAYDAMTSSIGNKFQNPLSAISQSYASGETDEFITPKIIVDENNIPVHSVSDNDALIFFNFRSDRARQITMAFNSVNFNAFHRKKIIQNLYFVSMIPYGAEKEIENSHIHSLFQPRTTSSSLAKIISENKLNQLHIAETEKYAHVTYFFNGGIETPYPGEDRILVQSPKVPTYDKKPEMSAEIITQKLIGQLKKKPYSFVVLNFANPDMVGHTGDYNATIKAIECIDREIGKIMKVVNLEDTVIIITADHGNAEEVFNPESGEIDTEHSANPVPCIVVCSKNLNIKELKNDMKLANVASTILYLLNLKIPDFMEEKLF